MEANNSKTASNLRNIKNKTNFFGSIIKKLSKGDKDREMFWWDIFKRYEVTIGICIGIILAIIVTAILYPIIVADNNAMQNKFFNGFFGFLGAIFGGGLFFSLFLAGLMVFPFFHLTKGTGESATFSPHRRYDIGPARLGFANLLCIGGIIIIFYAIIRLCYKCIYISNVIGIIIACLFIILLIVAAINAISYGNWRFDWAIDNQDLIYSRYDKYRTSNVYFASERMQWKHLRWYKMMVAIVLLAGPSILGTSYILTTSHHSQKKHHSQKTEIIERKEAKLIEETKPISDNSKPAKSAPR